MGNESVLSYEDFRFNIFKELNEYLPGNDSETSCYVEVDLADPKSLKEKTKHFQFCSEILIKRVNNFTASMFIFRQQNSNPQTGN